MGKRKQDVDVIDGVLGFFSMFDWISPLVATAQDIANGPNHTLMIPQNCGWCGKNIERTLRQRGIKTWGGMIVKHTIMITVKRTDMDAAYSVLERNRIPWGSG